MRIEELYTEQFYDRHERRYKFRREQFIIYIEYWSVWKKEHHLKLKITRCPPNQNIDSYGWKLIYKMDVFSCYPLDKYRVMYIK